MKKLIFTILTTITILGVNAQGNNLQFNRALFENYNPLLIQDPSSSFGTYYKIMNSAVVVPNNKIWKITNVQAEASDNILSTGTGVVYISKSGLNLFNRILQNEERITWLPSGSYDLKVTSTGYPNISVLITGLEFNIVQ